MENRHEVSKEKQAHMQEFSKKAKSITQTFCSIIEHKNSSIIQTRGCKEANGNTSGDRRQDFSVTDDVTVATIYLKVYGARLVRHHGGPGISQLEVGSWRKT